MFKPKLITTTKFFMHVELTLKLQKANYLTSDWKVSAPNPTNKTKDK